MKTVKVRVAVAVDAEGNWVAFGTHHGTELDGFLDDIASGERYFFLTAELPIPEVTEVEAKVEG